MMEFPTAFPWTLDGGGLCHVLRDTALWAEVFKHDRDFRAALVQKLGPRQARSSLIPAALRKRALGPAPDDQKFGTLLVDLLADPRKRQRFGEFVKEVLRRGKATWHGFLGYKLLQHLKETGQIPEGSFEFLEGDSDSTEAGTPGPETSDVPEDAAMPPRPLSLFACALALSKPHAGKGILERVFGQSPVTRELLSDRTLPPLPTSPPTSLDTSVVTEPGPSQAEVASAAPPPLPRETAELLRLLTEDADWTSNLSLERLRVAVALVGKKAGEEGARQSAVEELRRRLGAEAIAEAAAADTPIADALVRLAELDRRLNDLLRERVSLGSFVLDRLHKRHERNEERLRQHDSDLEHIRKELSQVAQLPWVKGSGFSGAFPPLLVGGTLKVAQERLDETRRQLSRIFQADSSLREWTSRLGETPAPLIRRGTTVLSEVAGTLEDAATACRARFEKLAAREQSAAEFFDRFGTAVSADSAGRLVQSTTPECWEDVGRFLLGRQPSSEAGKRYHELIGRADLVGLLAAYLWSRDADRAALLIADGLTDPQAPESPCSRLLAFLRFDQLQRLATDRPETAPTVAGAILVSALRSAEPTALAYLEPLLHLSSLPPTCTVLCRACLEEWANNTPLNAVRLTDLLAPRPAEDIAARAEQYRGRVLDYIRGSPTMIRNYLRLRLLARQHFLEPLQDAVEARDPERAWREWREQGNLDERVEECVRLSGRRLQLDQSHRTQTARYLQDFEALLTQWRRCRRDPAGARDDYLRHTLTALQREAGRSLACASFWRPLQLLRDDPDAPNLPPADFGDRLDLTDPNEPGIVHAQELVTSLMTWSWPSALRGAVPVRLVLCDWLRQALRQAPAGLADAVEDYWSRGEFLVAAQTAASDAALAQGMGERIRQKRDDIRSAHAAILREAQECREHDRDIDACLVAVEEDLEELQFQEASGWLQELGELVRQFKARRDPVRLDLLEQLREAGLLPDEQATADELRRLLDGLKKQHEFRRLHVVELERAASNSRLPAPLRERWGSLGRSLDRPSLWPAEETAVELEWVVQHCLRYLEGRLQDREYAPEIADLLAARFAEWLPEQLRAVLTFQGETEAPALRDLRQLVEDILRYRSIQHILRRLGAAPVVPAPTVPAPVVTPSVPLAAAESTPEPAARSRDRRPDTTEVVRKLRDFLTERARLEPTTDIDPGSAEVRLRTSFRSLKWKETRALAATLLLHSPPAEESSPVTAVETVYAVALACSTPVENRAESLEAYQAAALATLSTDRSEYAYYAPAALTDLNPAARGLVLAVAAAPFQQALSPELPSLLAQALVRFVELPPADPALEWLRDLFWRAGRIRDDAAARLADLLWDGLRGKDNEEPRTCLLRLLFQFRSREALRHLARHAEQIADLVKVCLNVFEQAEEDSSLRLQAREILLTLREQSTKKPNRLPWINLFQSLEAVRGETGEAAVQCATQSNFLDRGSPDEPAVVQVLLTPALSDPPRRLDLHFLRDDTVPGGAVPIPIPLVRGDEELLLRPRAVDVTVPDDALIVTGDLIDVGYRLTGETVLRNKIELRGNWQFHRRYHTPSKLENDEITAAWPGASGVPVAECGFHGRGEEMHKVDQHLRARDRMHSLMICGERRIGKTSLLKELVHAYPRRRVGICGAFFDCYGLDTPPGTMATKFFEFVVSKLDNEVLNEEVRKALRERAGRPVKVAALAHGLRPEVALEDALNQLVERLAEASGGLIGRMVFFFDEFDRFVAPYLADEQQRNEVVRLHGSLRQIIQRSERLALVMAGSGLQRLFTNEYTHPFYGSLAELSLGSFDWGQADGRDAAEKTFLPERLRPRLCPDPAEFARVAERACDLCGGNPYFLSMLGCAVGRAWRGHPLTPEMLNRVADLMIQNKLEVGNADINRKKFYQFLFASLDSLPPRDQAVAKLMLVSIARLTSTAQQRWRKYKLVEEQFIEDPEVRRLTTEDQRLKALKYLQDEGVVEFEKGRSELRIRIPLRAAAIREDATEVYLDALSALRAAGGAGR
jgi:hypothetical protein